MRLPDRVIYWAGTLNSWWTGAPTDGLILWLSAATRLQRKRLRGNDQIPAMEGTARFSLKTLKQLETIVRLRDERSVNEAHRFISTLSDEELREVVRCAEAIRWRLN